MTKEIPFAALDLKEFRFEDRYYVKHKLGDGSFGTVYLAKRKGKQGHEQAVAVKKLKTSSKPKPKQELLKLRESLVLQQISKHPGLIDLLETFMDPNKNIYLVMECMEANLYQILKRRQGKPFTKYTACHILNQIIRGIEHIHTHGFMHRDVKPENILVKKLTDRPVFSRYSVKIADFGLARSSTSNDPLTEYVSTRWYRAPELLLRAKDYGKAVDMYAFGCITFEVFTLKPLFPGRNETDQLNRICEILGNPLLDVKDKLHYWPSAKDLAVKLGFSFSSTRPYPIRKLLPATCDDKYTEMITQLLAWDPFIRPSAISCKERYFPKSPELPNGQEAKLVSGKANKPGNSKDDIAVKPNAEKRQEKRVSWFKKNLYTLTNAVKNALPEASPPHLPRKPIKLDSDEKDNQMSNPLMSETMNSDESPSKVKQPETISCELVENCLLPSYEQQSSHFKPQKASQSNLQVTPRIPIETLSAKSQQIVNRVPKRDENKASEEMNSPRATLYHDNKFYKAPLSLNLTPDSSFKLPSDFDTVVDAPKNAASQGLKIIGINHSLIPRPVRRNHGAPDFQTSRSISCQTYSNLMVYDPSLPVKIYRSTSEGFSKG
ncbi:serine/threonine protein kinase, meiotic, STKc MAK-like Mde3 [Schizosaccharomyces osmophilus]|uniref:Serine/threonine protein kinase, meiotic, STKc MAK-like Mde3 n=1 Tax=Schizosaccharomyces osmophilus TaxID=2545709 RepID=A0AAE9WA15_9SCHI|nr:serine/threonine protein kinase, meiotic, STKc MAK-like Mde3 [Schizosaccharomyces osmophilus]WBW70748.1 serine/threonine protein kinase, meiotic, STKc MAK-like Mde3 [Schizosaccharomyces osmophilus]